jgi:oligosaccharide repeat unit polymerase
VDTLLSACVVVGLIPLLLAGREIQGHWIGPSTLPAALWIVAAGGPLLDPSLHVFLGGYTLIIVLAATLALGAAIGLSRIQPAVCKAPPLVRSDWNLYVVSVALGALAPLILFRNASAYVSTSNLADLALDATMARYEGELGMPFTARLFQMFNYFAAIFGGFLLAADVPTRNRKIVAMLWLVPLVATGAVYTSKAQLLFGSSFFATGWVCGKAYTGSLAEIRMGRLLAWGGAAVGVLLAFSVATMALRYGRLELSDLPFVLERFTGYLTPHMMVFGSWFHGYDPLEGNLGLGVASFSGPAQLLGLHERLLGLYGSTQLSESNIYTYARPLLEDFGLVGSLGCLSLGACITGIAWRLLCSGRLAVAPTCAAYFIYVMWSPICSAFAYTTIGGAVLMFACWCLVRQRASDISNA